MMKEYRNDMNENHAPEALIQQTLGRIREEELHNQNMVIPFEKKKKKKGGWIAGIASIAAAFVLVCGIAAVQFVTPSYEYTELSSGMIRDYIDLTGTTNVKTEYREYEDGQIMIKVSDGEIFAPKELLDGNKEKIEHIDVHLGCYNDVYFAAFSIEGKNFLIRSEDVSQKDFEKFLKEFL